MRRLRVWLIRLVGSFHQESRDRELGQEIESNLQLHIEDNLRAGMGAAEARRQALIKLGGIEATKEAYRERRGIPLFETMVQDLRYALRMMLKNPGFTLVAVLSLALGICANTTIFSAINTLLFRRLPYQDSDRLVAIVNHSLKDGGSHMVSTGDFANWQKQNTVFEQMELTNNFASKNVLVGGGGSERVGIQYLTPGLFRLLGVQPILGRLLLDEEAKPTNASSVVLSYGYWHRRFGNDPGVLGKSFFVDTSMVTVVGVLSPGFDLLGTGETDIYQPISAEGASASEMSDRWLMAVARLKPGVQLEQAQSSMDVVAGRLEQAYPATNKDLGIRVMPLRDGLFGWARQVLYPLLAAVAFVLLIACANIANLMLSRASNRRKEVGIRGALGASRLRLIRQMLTESVVLALLGGMLGLVLSFWGIKAFVTLVPQWYPQAGEITIDARVLVFTLAVSILTGIVFGLAPALRASQFELTESLKEGGRSSSAGARHRTRSIIVVAEVALALVLLVSAGLMMNTFLRVLHASPGFRSDHVLTLEFRLTGTKYLDASAIDKTGFDTVAPQVDIFCRQVLERVKALPGVESAALIDWLPMTERADNPSRDFSIAGRPASEGGEKPNAFYSAISPDYFRVMQIPLVRGRYPGEQDTSSTPWVVVINEAMAHKFWPNQDPIGQVITLETVPGEERPRQIVGVVGNVKQFTSGRDPDPEIYAPYLQQPKQSPSMFTETRLHKSLVVRTSFESKSLIDSVRYSVAEMDHGSPVFGVTTVRNVVLNSTTGERFYTQLLGGFAIVAMLLAAIGIYGVISYSVLERSHEIGVRMALGGQSKQVLKLMLKEGLTLSALGVAVGVAGSFAATPLIAAFLYGVKAYDLVTWSLVSAFLMVVTLVATYIPGRRATQVDPMVALRCE
ncbi:MAG TPA: ABC transporter permease [Terriglobales bacterium]|nr:ABC transporter permease [Terriglobales bacterium]